MLGKKFGFPCFFIFTRPSSIALHHLNCLTRNNKKNTFPNLVRRFLLPKIQVEMILDKMTVTGQVSRKSCRLNVGRHYLISSDMTRVSGDLTVNQNIMFGGKMEVTQALSFSWVYDIFLRISISQIIDFRFVSFCFANYSKRFSFIKVNF